MVGDRRGVGGGRIVVLAALAAVVAACGSGTPPGATPCPPGATTGTVTVAQVLASMAEAVACPTNPVYPTDACYAGTAWSVGPNLFLTSGHGVHSGALGPQSKSASRPYIQVTQGNPVFSGGQIVPNAKIVAYDVTNSDIALIQTTDLSLPALPISTKNVVAGLTGTDVCDLNTIDNIIPPPTANVFTGTTGAVHPTGLGTNGGPTTEFDLTQPSSGPGSPEGCSGSPVLVAGQVAGAVFAGTGNGISGGGGASVVPAPALRSALHLASPGGACGGSQPAPLLSSMQPLPASDLPSGSGAYNDATCPWSTTCLAVGTVSGHGVVTRSTNSGASWSTTDVGNATALAAISCASPQICFAGGTIGTKQPAMFVTENAGQSWTEQTVPSTAIVGSIACTDVASSTSCIAVGADSTPQGVSTVISTINGGATWTQERAPSNNLTTVRCFGVAHCWIAGPGAWFTSNLGATWKDVQPPEEDTGCPSGTGFGLCNSATWSKTIDIEFQTTTDGWVVGGDQCGGQEATQCSGAVYHTTDGGATWTFWTGSTKDPFGWQIFCSALRCLYVANTFTHSELFGTLDGSTWAELKSIPMLVSALACPPVGTFCILAGGLNGGAALDVLGSG